MKKFYAILCLAIASLTQLQAQAPQGFNYQATVRNSSGDLIINTNVYFKTGHKEVITWVLSSIQAVAMWLWVLHNY